MLKSSCACIWIGGVVCFLCLVMPVSKVYALAESTAPGGSNAQAVHVLGEMGDGVNVGLISGANGFSVIINEWVNFPPILTVSES